VNTLLYGTPLCKGEFLERKSEKGVHAEFQRMLKEGAFLKRDPPGGFNKGEEISWETKFSLDRTREVKKLAPPKIKNSTTGFWGTINGAQYKTPRRQIPRRGNQNIKGTFKANKINFTTKLNNTGVQNEN